MIIESLLDTDLYKLTMMQAVMEKYPFVPVKYEFKNRGDEHFTSVEVDKIRKEIHNLTTLRFTKEELKYLSSISFFKPEFIEYLKLFQFDRDNITITEDNGILSITIHGSWLTTILYEVFVLSIVNEVYFQKYDNTSTYYDGFENFSKKITLLNEYGKHINIADFGTRRRFSRHWHRTVVESLIKENKIIGTSNVKLAMDLGIKPIGTMAHEWIQAHQQLGVRLADSQKQAFEVWSHVYRGDLGIALTDCISMDAFLNDFDLYFSKLFDGCRHDSGDPYKWCNQLINHYEKMGIDPKTKYAVFSDGLDIPTAINIHKEFADKINVSFGIGTNLTNDRGVKPLSIVIKMTECNGKPVAKLSDSPGKTMCNDENYLNYLKKVFNYEY